MMTTEAELHIPFDVDIVAEGLGLPAHEVINCFADGRRYSMIAERQIAKLVGAELAESERSSYDIIYSNKETAEVRCLTARMSFRPSNQIGQGRIIDDEAMFQKWDVVSKFLVVDLTKENLKMGKLPVYEIPIFVIYDLYESGALGKNAQISRKKFFQLFVTKKRKTL